jgi:hypothetical protein
MEEISRFDRQVKQGKIWDADCTCPYSPYGHVEGRTIMVMWQLDDVAYLYWLIVVQLDVDTCHIGSKWHEGTWPNTWAPRVPRGLDYIGYVKINGGHGVRPPDLPHCKDLTHIR